MRGIRRVPEAAATNDQLLAMVASQKTESHEAKHKAESLANDGGNGVSMTSPRNDGWL